MPDRGDASFGTFPAAGTKRIRRHIDIGSGGVLMRQPAEVAALKCTLPRNDYLNNLCRTLPPKKQCNGLTRSEATGEEVGGDMGRDPGITLPHDPPRKPARSGTAWRCDRN